MATLMSDPVILTTSGVTVDRSTIVAHLLNDKTDPFNRKPLSVDLIEPNEALKERINAFKIEKKKESDSVLNATELKNMKLNQ